MLTVYAKATCGCCTIAMQFKDEAAATVAFKQAGLTSSATIRDDNHTVHEDVDVFYGFSLSEAEQAGRSLGFLANQLPEE